MLSLYCAVTSHNSPMKYSHSSHFIIKKTKEWGSYISELSQAVPILNDKAGMGQISSKSKLMLFIIFIICQSSLLFTVIKATYTCRTKDSKTVQKLPNQYPQFVYASSIKKYYLSKGINNIQIHPTSLKM